MSQAHSLPAIENIIAVFIHVYRYEVGNTMEGILECLYHSSHLIPSDLISTDHGFIWTESPAIGRRHSELGRALWSDPVHLGGGD